MKDRNRKGQFIKRHGFWTGKKRPNLLNTDASKTMFKKGLIPWNKIGLTKKCIECGKKYKTDPSSYDRRKCCSHICARKYNHKFATCISDRDKPCKECGILIMRKSTLCRSCANKGSRSSFYIHGKAKENWTEREIIKATAKYKKWRMSIFERDNFKCIWCGSKKFIQVDHIKSFRNYPKLRFEISNGRTLCKDCHLTTPNYGGRAIYKGGDVHEFQI